MSAQNERQKNRPCVYGGLSMESMGPQNDLDENDWVTVNKADDYTLVYALGLRGYDVRVKAPAKDEIERRKRAKAKRDAAEAKASEG